MSTRNNPEPDTAIVPVETLNQAFGDYLRGQWYLEPRLAEYSRTDANISSMERVHDFIRIGFDNVIEALKTPDPLETPEKSYFDVKRRADKFLDDAAQHSMDARQSVEEQIKAIDRDIDDHLQIKESEYSQEIRAHFLRLSDGDRISAAHAAIEAFDKTTMGALLSSPAYLSGLTDEMQAALHSRYIEAQASDLVARKEVFQLARKVNLTAFDELLTAHGKLFPPERLAGIASRSNAALSVRDNIGRWAA